VTLDGQQVSQPMTVHVHGYSELRWAETPNLTTVGATVAFNFELYRIRGEVIEGHLTPASGGAVARARAVALGNNRYSVSFTPTKSDLYSLQLVIDSYRIPPQIDLKVLEHAASFTSGNEREGRVGSAFILRVALASSAGTNANVRAQIRNASTKEFVGDGEVTRTSDGVSVKWVPRRPGRYTLSLEVDGVALPSSDVSLVVPASRQVRVVHNSELRLGEPVNFTFAIDSEEVTHSLSGTVTVHADASRSTAYPLRINRNAEGTWDASFTVPNEAKSFTVDLTADGHALDNRITLELV